MDRLTSVEWLRMKADGFINLTEKERFLEAADEIERLQQTVSMLAGDRDLYIEEIKKKNAEIERLREALRAINRKNDNPAWFNPDIHEIVETALHQKETE